MNNVMVYQSPIGALKITEANGAISSLVLLNSTPAATQQPATPLLQKAAAQLDEYFAGKRKIFDLPLAQQGTDFQQRVWQALCSIPYGKTCTYKQIAEQCESPKGFRAVGMANNQNHIPIIVPCHRVIGTSGKLVGYALGLHVKQFLLDLEKSNI